MNRLRAQRDGKAAGRNVRLFKQGGSGVSHCLPCAVCCPKAEEQIFFNLLTFDRDCGILKAERIFEFIDDLL